MPGRFLPAHRLRPDRCDCLPAGHGRRQDQPGDSGAVREGRLPGLPGAARAIRSADRGPGRILACAGARRARAGRVRPAGTGREPQGRLPRLPVLVRLPRLPRAGGPGQGGAAATAGADRGEPVGGVPARARTVHRCTDRPSPRGEVLQRVTQALRAVLFDMDGLLVDSEPLWFEAERSVMARLGGSWAAADQRELIGGSLAHTVGYMRSRARRQVPPGQIASWLLGTMTELVTTAPVPLMPGAAELLASLDAAGIPRGLVTSAQRQIMAAVLASTGLAFAITVCGEDVHAVKPGPEPYRRAAALL